MSNAAPAVKNPYPGLRPFEPEDSELFFGRNRQIDELLPRLRDRRFLAVLGVSGSGKSSLVRAGLIPALKVGHLTSSGSRWRIAMMRPGSKPLEALAAALDQALGPAADRLANLRKSTNAVLSQSRTGRAPDESLLLLVDQFEELFRVEDTREAAYFVDLLLAVEQDLSPTFRTYVVLTMRTDRLGECSQFEGLPEALNRSQYLVPKLGTEELHEAIEGPAALTDTAVEPGLVQRLVVEASVGADRLPLLQHLLMTLWRGREFCPDGSGLISLAHYDVARSAADALNDHADQTLGTLSADRQRVASLVFRALTGSGGSRDLRRPRRLSQLTAETGAPIDQVRAVVEHFLASNFITSSDRDFTEDWEADITHESLIRQWKKLSGWLDEEAADAEDYRYYSLNAVRKASLLTGRSLDSALRWLAKGHNAAWAARYGGDFEAAVEYIRESERAYVSQIAEAEFDLRWRHYWAPAGVILAFVLVLSQFAKLNRLAEPVFRLMDSSFTWVQDNLTGETEDGFPAIKDHDFTPAITMFFVATITFCLYLVLERYGRPVLHRYTSDAIRDRVLKSSGDDRVELPLVSVLYASFGRRVVAVLVDGFLFVLSIIGTFVALIFAELSQSTKTEMILWWGFCLSAQYLYNVASLASKRQATLGMLVAEVYVSDVYGHRLSFKRASLRHVAKLLTVCSVFGFLMPAWAKRRQTLHDWLVGSVALPGEPAETASRIPVLSVGYAGYGRRVLGAFVDGLLLYAGIRASTLALTLVALGRNPHPALIYGVPLIGHYLYQVATTTSKRQATLGMRVARVSVADVYGNRLSWKRASIRYAAKLLTIFSLLGSLMPLWTKRRQTLHDVVAGSVILRRSGAENKAETVPAPNTTELTTVSALFKS